MKAHIIPTIVKLPERRCIGMLLVIAALLTPSFRAFSQSYGKILTLLDQRRFVDAEGLLDKKLLDRPDDDSAHYLLGQLIVRSRTADRYDEAIGHFTKCVASQPAAATYNLWLGRAFGVKAQDAGGLTAAGYLGDIRQAFLKALALDPGNCDARYDLIQFYLRTPGILGGSNSKARELAEESKEALPDLAPFLLAAIDMYGGAFDSAYAKATAVTKPADDVHLGYYRYALSSLGFSFLDNSQPGKAAGLFMKFTSEFPALAIGYHGLGRSYFDAGKTDDAIASFEKAILLNHAIGSQYRLGLAYEKKGDRERAIRSFGEFLQLKFQVDQNFITDAHERLNRLGEHAPKSNEQ